MSSNWYSGIKDLCFDAKFKISDAAFLLLFAPHCIAASANFGQQGHNRSFGAAPKNKRLSDSEKQQKQVDFLNTVKKAISGFSGGVISQSIKESCYNLSVEILEKCLKCEDDKKYAQKNSSYKKNDYLNIYFDVDNSMSKDVFSKVAELYRLVFEKIYNNCEEEVAERLKALKEQCESKGIDLEYINVSSNFSQSTQMARCTAALMILFAAPDKYDFRYNNIKQTLLGIIESESTATVSTVVESITITGEEYIRMSHRILDSNPDFEDLEMIFKHLEKLCTKMSGTLCSDLYALAQHLKKAVDKLGMSVLGEILSSGNFIGTPQQQKKKADLEKLFKNCEKLLVTEESI